MKLKYIYWQEPVIYSYLHTQGLCSCWFKSHAIEAVGVTRGNSCNSDRFDDKV